MTDLLPWQLVAALMIGLSKGGLATVGTLAVPMLALVMNPLEAAALMLPTLIVTDWFAVWLYRREYSRRNVAILLPSIFLGIFIATLIVPFTPESLLLVVTGSVGLWYCLRNWFGKSRHAPPREAKIVPGMFWGALTGITTFITHSGGPPTQAFLLPQRMPRMIFAGTIVITFAVTNIAKIPGYYALGYFEDMHWNLIALLATVGVSGTAIGRQIVKRLTDQTYVRVIEILLFTLSIILFSKAIYIIFVA